MPPENCSPHKKSLCCPLTGRWAPPTHIGAAYIMANKHHNGFGVRNMQRVVKYQALEAFTIVTGLSIPLLKPFSRFWVALPIFIRVISEQGFTRFVKLSTAFYSVTGLFQCRVVPFGLNGSPAIFQANISTYLQPMSGQSFIA